MSEMKKVLIPIFLGIIAGLLSFLITQNLRERDAFGIIVLVFFIYLQKFIFPKIKIKLEPKDWVGLAFLCLTGWYVTWVFLLNI
ncbi:MAG: hypothetical protein QXN34_03325 [Archaeoglobaceae archaeon]